MTQEASSTLRVLMVCVGNVCRSPLAERSLRVRLGGHGLNVAEDGDVWVTSAGVRAMVGSQMEPNAAAELQKLGGDPEGFVSRQVTSDLIKEADLVLAATSELRSQLLLVSPLALRRAFTMREFAALVQLPGADATAKPLAELLPELVAQRSELRQRELDVPDPMGRGAEAHSEAAQLIDESLEVIAELIAKTVKAPAPAEAPTPAHLG